MQEIYNETISLSSKKEKVHTFILEGNFGCGNMDFKILKNNKIIKKATIEMHCGE